MHGRKSHFNDEMIEKAEDYINGGYKELNTVIPSIIGLSEWLGVGKSTLYDWNKKKDHPISDILERCLNRQHEILITNGLTGDFNSNITKLVLGKHGYSDRSENKNEDTINVRIAGDDAETL